MLFQANSSVNRIKIAATNGGEPKMIITKPTFDADTETDPDNMRFSTAFNYFKIIAQGTDDITFGSTSVSSGGSTGQPQTVTTTASGKLGVIAFIEVDDGFVVMTRQLPYIVPQQAVTGGITYKYECGYKSSNGTVQFTRTGYNNSSVSLNMPAETIKISWYLLAETVAT